VFARSIKIKNVSSPLTSRHIHARKKGPLPTPFVQGVGWLHPHTVMPAPIMPNQRSLAELPQLTGPHIAGHLGREFPAPIAFSPEAAGLIGFGPGEKERGDVRGEGGSGDQAKPCLNC